MQLDGGVNWRIDVRDPDDLVVALYVRDACRLRTSADIPALTPLVAPSSTPTVDPAELSGAWDSWWSALLSRRSNGAPRVGNDLGITSAAGPLEAVATALRRPALDWRAAHPFEPPRWHQPGLPAEVALLETHLVADVGRALGREVAPFTYSVEVIPVRGRRFWDLSPVGLLVSEELIEDADAYRDVLRPRLTALA